MPIVKGLSAMEGSAVEYYCNPNSKTYNNWTRSYERAGYSLAKGWERNASKVLVKPRVKDHIQQYRDKTGQKWDHDRQISVDGLNFNLIRLQHKADNGDVQACAAITSIYRELNAISNLHSNTVFDGKEDKPQLSAEEQAYFDELASDMLRSKLKLHTG